MSRKKRGKAKPSLKPQHVNSMVWYYESIGHIDFIIDLPELARRQMYSRPYHVCIPKRKLETSLRRMSTKREQGRS